MEKNTECKVIGNGDIGYTIFKCVHAGIIIIDYETSVIVDANPAACMILGMNEDDVRGRKCEELLCNGEDICSLLTIDEDNNFIESDEQRSFIRRDGSVKHVLANVVSILWHNKRHMVVSLADVTDKIKVEREMMRQKERAQLYLDVAQDIFLALDMEGNIVLINQSGCDVLGIDECFLLGMNWFDNFVLAEDKERLIQEFENLITMGPEQDQPFVFENYIINSAEDRKLIKWKTVVVRDESGDIISTFSSGEDVTDQRKAEQELEMFWDKTAGKLTENLALIKKLRQEEDEVLTDELGIGAVIDRVREVG